MMVNLGASLMRMRGCLSSRSSRVSSVRVLTMAAWTPGIVISSSRFHFRTRWGGQITSTLLNCAMWAAAPPM